MKHFDPIPEHKVSDLKNACRVAGVPATGTKCDMFSRLVERLETASSDDVKTLLALGGVFDKIEPFAYRAVRVDELVAGEPTHNGYCTDSVEYVGREPEPGRRKFDYRGDGEYYVRFWFNMNKRRYAGSDTVPVSLRWLRRHDKKWM